MATTNDTDDQGEQQQTPPVEPSEQDAEQAPGQAPAEGARDQQGTEGGDADDDLKDLPEKTRNELKRLRRENADRRVTNRDLQERIAAAESLEQKAALVDQLTADLASERRSNLVSQALLTHGLPTEAGVMLSGSDPQVIEQQAQFLASLRQGGTVPQPPPSTPSGGMQPHREPEASIDDLLAKLPGRR